MRIGVIADTHGLLRPEALIALAGADHIIHAGDVGGPEILEQLRAIAPLTTVRGNCDGEPWADVLSITEIIEANGISIYVLHDLQQLDLAPAAAGIRVVISGHSHKAMIREEAGVLYLNPGSAGPRRFRLPVTLAILTIMDLGGVTAQIMPLQK